MTAQLKPDTSLPGSTAGSAIWGDRKEIIGLLAISLLTIICFYPVDQKEFTNWDDQTFITQNQLLRDFSPVGLWGIFSSHDNYLYMPLTTLSRALIYHIMGPEPSAFQWFNLLLHVINLVLVYVLFRGLTAGKNIALITCLLFAVHPWRTEPVSWTIGGVYLLSTTFFLAALIQYLKFLRDHQWKYYWVSLLATTGALLSSFYAVSLPLVIVLVDMLRHRPLTKRILLEKLPFFGISVLFGIIAVVVMEEPGSLQKARSFTEGILFGAYGYIHYIYQFLWPLNLSAFYPYPDQQQEWLPWIYYAAPLLMLGVLGLSIFYGKTGRLWAWGMLLYSVSILLFLKFSFLDPYGKYIAADRYTYIPSLGLSFAAAVLFDQMISRLSFKQRSYKIPLYIGLGIFAMILVVVSYQRNKIWQNSETLWTSVIEAYPRVRLAYNNRANHRLYRQNNFEQAMKDYNKAIEIAPKYAPAYLNRGNAYSMTNQYDKAMADFDRSISLDPGNYKAYSNKGNAYWMQQRLPEALQAYNKALEIHPENKSTLVNRGNVLTSLGQYEKALADYHKAIKLYPDYASAYFNRGNFYKDTGRPELAIRDFNRTLQLDPEHKQAWWGRSHTYYTLGQYPNALQDALNAQKLGYPIEPSYIELLRKNQ